MVQRGLGVQPLDRLPGVRVVRVYEQVLHIPKGLDDRMRRATNGWPGRDESLAHGGAEDGAAARLPLQRVLQDAR